MERILVTGADSWVGRTTVAALANRPDCEVFAVGSEPGEPAAGVEHYQGAVDELAFAEYLLDVRPHAVLHLAPIDRAESTGAIHGAQALFGAIKRSPETTRVVVKSETSVYGCGPRSPSVLRESDLNGGGRMLRHQRRLRELEAFIREISDSQPAVTYTVLRFAAIIGPEVGNAMSRWLRLRSVPVRLGYDPRLQFIFETDAVRAVVHALDHQAGGAFNVAADGQLYLSRILRLGGRIAQPLPGRAFGAARKGLRLLDINLTEDMEALLRYGRVVDTARMRQELGFAPVLNCRQTVLATYGRVPPEALPRETAHA